MLVAPLTPRKLISIDDDYKIIKSFEDCEFRKKVCEERRCQKGLKREHLKKKNVCSGFEHNRRVCI